MKQLILINGLVIFIGLIALVATVTAAGRRDNAALKDRLSYLADIPEISWTVIVKNNVYIGFIRKINDMGFITRAAAVQGNKAYGFGVHVYAVDGYQADWKKSKHYCTATARRGVITKSNCK